jgi:hypothetical protein
VPGRHRQKVVVRLTLIGGFGRVETRGSMA